MPTDLRTTAARRRAELVSDGVTASYIHSITRPVHRPADGRRALAQPASLRPAPVRPAPARLRPGARPRRVSAPAPAAA